MVDPASGQNVKVKEVATKVDNTHHKFEMFAVGPDGNSMKVMEIAYTKKS